MDNDNQTLSPAELNARIKRMLPLSPTDLEANRQGRVTREQLERMTVSNSSVNTIVFIIIGGALLATGGLIFVPLLMTGEITENYPEYGIYFLIGAGIAFGLFSLYILLMTYSSLRSGQRPNLPFADNAEIHSVTGSIRMVHASQLVQPQVTGKGYDPIPRSERQYKPPSESLAYTVIRVDEVEVASDNAKISLILENGASYRIYYVNGTGRYAVFISAEAV